MRGPGWRGDEIAVGDSFGHGEIYVGTPGLCDVGTDAILWVGLVVVEVMDGGADGFAGLVAVADRVDRVADHQQRLERNHQFVVFNVVTNKHENGFLGHEGPPRKKESNNAIHAGLKSG